MNKENIEPLVNEAENEENTKPGNENTENNENNENNENVQNTRQRGRQLDTRTLEQTLIEEAEAEKENRDPNAQEPLRRSQRGVLKELRPAQDKVSCYLFTFPFFFAKLQARK